MDSSTLSFLDTESLMSSNYNSTSTEKVILTSHRRLFERRDQKNRLTFPNLKKIPPDAQDVPCNHEELAIQENKALLNYGPEIEYLNLPLKKPLERRILNMSRAVKPSASSQSHLSTREYLKSLSQVRSRINDHAVGGNQFHHNHQISFNGVDPFDEDVPRQFVRHEISAKLYQMATFQGKKSLRFLQDSKTTERMRAKGISAKTKRPVLDDIYSMAEEQLMVKTNLEHVEEDLSAKVKKILSQHIGSDMPQEDSKTSNATYSSTRRDTQQLSTLGLSLLTKDKRVESAVHILDQKDNPISAFYKSNIEELTRKSSSVPFPNNENNDPPAAPAENEEINEANHSMHIATPRILRKKLNELLQQQKRASEAASRKENSSLEMQEYELIKAKNEKPAREKYRRFIKDASDNTENRIIPGQAPVSGEDSTTNGRGDKSTNLLGFDVNRLETVFKPLVDFFEGPLAVPEDDIEQGTLVKKRNLSFASSVNSVGANATSMMNVMPQELEAFAGSSLIKNEFIKPFLARGNNASKRAYRKINLYEDQTLPQTVLPKNPPKNANAKLENKGRRKTSAIQLNSNPANNVSSNNQTTTGTPAKSTAPASALGSTAGSKLKLSSK